MRCAACKSENPDGFRYCGTCGAPIVDAGLAAAVERKVVTVVFADLAGFTSRAEQLDPEDLRAEITPYLAAVRRELERYGGTVEKFIGDAVMALFGAPVGHEDDPERAVRAALAIRDAIAELNGGGGPELGVRIAVNTGEAIVALGARPEAGEGMAAGDVVNTAFRLQESAPIGGVVVGESTFRATRDAVAYGEPADVRVKGKSEPIRVWRAIAPSDTPPRERGLHRASALVGRLTELDFLRDALDRARSGRCAQLVTLVGVPGIGKTRLVAELRAEAEAGEHVVWLRGRSLPYGEGVTFAALSEITKAHAGIVATDSADTAAEKLTRAVGRIGEDSADAHWVESHLRPLVGIGTETDQAGGTPSEAFAAWRRFLESLADDGTVVLVFEDLHWADDGLLDFIDYLVEWSADFPLLVLATARPEFLERRPGWGGGKRNAATLSLPPLADEEIASLVEALLERSVAEWATNEALVSRAGGNPLYAEEYARMLREAPELELPESLQGIIAARIDALGFAEKRLLQDAAVVGNGFSLGVVAAVSGLARGRVEELLHALVRKEFVRRERRSSASGDRDFTFGHVLVRDVAYAQIPRATRAEKHRRAAEWIGSLTADRPDDHAEMLAHHYLAAIEYAGAAGRSTAELVVAAREALRDAGDRAAALNAYAAAARHYRTAVELTPDDDERFADLLFRYGKALFASDEAGAETLSRARDLLLAAGERASAAEAEAMLAWFDRSEGRAEEADARLRRAHELVRDAPASASKAAVLTRVAGYFMVAEALDDALGVGGEALELAERLELDDLRAHALVTRGVVRTTLGDLAGLEDLERGIELANEAGVPEAAIRGYNNLASVVANMGDLARAFELAQSVRSTADRFGLATQIRWVAAEEMQHRYWLGEWDEALRLANEIIQESERGARYYWEPVARVVRGHIRLAQGESADAVDDASKGVDFAREIGDPQILFASLAFAARAFLQASEPENASALVSELYSAWIPTGVVHWLPDLAVASEATGQGGAFLDAAAKVTLPSMWVDSGRAFVQGEHARAADLYAEIGSRPDEAYARLRAAEAAFAADGAAAERELARALEFFRSVGAFGYAGQAANATGSPTSSP